MFILANPAVIFAIAGLIGLALLAALYWVVGLLVRWGVCRDA